MIRFTVAIALVALVASGARAAEPAKPNVVVIMSDDMGFSDLGCYGGEIRTPNLDALAAGGLRFTQFYNTARCCPTRASLLTGLYPHQAGIGHMMDDKGAAYPGYRGNLNASCRTIAEVLKPAGYRNYAVGKWHVTPPRHEGRPEDNWPLARGFDRYYGTIHGAGSFYDPSSLVRDNTMISPFADPEYKPATYYYTDAISDHAVRFVGDHAKDHATKPFFLYVAYTAAHWPMHALPEDIAKYKGKYDGGYEPIRKARFEKAAKLGLIDPKQGMSPQAGRLGQGDRQEVGGGRHGSVRGDDRPHGPGHRQARRGVEAHRAVRQHADPVPAGQRRLRRTRRAAPGTRTTRTSSGRRSRRSPR